jgi:uncharacterized protein YndB with AHSA1/START domain
MTIADLTRIDRSVELAASPERVWHALTDARELSTWFHVTIEGALAAGSDVWMTSVHPEHAGQRFRVRIREMTPPRRLVWQWHPGEVDPRIDYTREPVTTVTFDLARSAGGTTLNVSETGFDDISLERRAKVYRDNTQGWAEVLVWLRNHVEAAR